MKKIASVFCVIPLLFMCSACATLKTANNIKDVDLFLTAEKAKGAKPETKEYKVTSITPSLKRVSDNSAERFAGATNTGGIFTVFIPVVYDVARVAVGSALMVKDALTYSHG